MNETIKQTVLYLDSLTNWKSSVPLSIIILSTSPMIYFTDFNNYKQIRITVMLLINIFMRLLYPSSYYPATQSKRGMLYHPLTARLIAFNAEVGLYELWAMWIGQCLWDNILLWMIVITGEVFSTVGVIIQSELILNFEDIIWNLHTFYMCYLSYPDIKTFFFYVSVFTYFFFIYQKGFNCYLVEKEL